MTVCVRLGFFDTSLSFSVEVIGLKFFFFFLWFPVAFMCLEV